MSNERLTDFSQQVREWVFEYIQKAQLNNGMGKTKIEIKSLERFVLSQMKANKMRMIPDIKNFSIYLAYSVEKVIKEKQLNGQLSIVRSRDGRAKPKKPVGRSPIREATYRSPSRIMGVRPK